MQALAVASTAVSAIGTLTSGSQQADAYKAEGKAQKSIADYQASQLRYRAGQEKASSQAAAEQERRKARLAISRGTAVAAASGGGVSDPTVMDILAGLRGEGEYNAKSALYEGEETAKGLEAQAVAAENGGAYESAAAAYKAKATRRASYVQAGGTLMSGAASFYDKFWPSSSSSTTPTSDSRDFDYKMWQ